MVNHPKSYFKGASGSRDGGGCALYVLSGFAGALSGSMAGNLTALTRVVPTRSTVWDHLSGLSGFLRTRGVLKKDNAVSVHFRSSGSSHN